MGTSFQYDEGDGREYAKTLNPLKIDYHDGKDHEFPTYWEHMKDFERRTLAGLRKAQDEGIEWVLFTHGQSTSRMGAQTARSVVRGIMRGKKGTPYIIRKKCVQLDSAFLAAIRKKPEHDKEAAEQQ